MLFQHLTLCYPSYHMCFSSLHSPLALGKSDQYRVNLTVTLELELCISQELAQCFNCLTTMSAAKFCL